MQNKKRFYLLVILLLSTCFMVIGQSLSYTDSLLKELKKKQEDTTKIKLYLELGKIFSRQSPDSGYYYFDLSLKLANKISSQKDIAMSLKSIGKVLTDKGSYDEALKSYEKAIKIAQELEDSTLLSACFNNTGLVYKYKGDYDQAQTYFMKALKIAEAQKDDRMISYVLIGLGNIMKDQKEFEKALEYYLKAKIIIEESGDKMGMSWCYNNIGIVYWSLDEIEKALEYYFKAIKVNEDLNDKGGVASCYNNIGLIYKGKGEKQKAIDFFNKSLKLKQELGDLNGVATNLNNLAATYISLKEYHKAIEFAKKGAEISEEIGVLVMLETNYLNLSVAYDSLGNYKEAYRYQKLYKSINDSIYNIETRKQITEIDTKYQAEKKQLELDKMQKQKELDNKTIEAQQETAKKQQIIIFSAISGFLIVLVFSFVLLRLFREKRKANILLAIKNTEITQQKEEIEAQRDEIEAQRDTVIIQKNNIEEQKKEITDSITYAKRIQNAILPSGEYANNILGEHFILFKPKDIVSGDFYWSTKINEWLIVAVADCTGHGVPGAFMSMLGVSFLNEIVRKKEVTKSSEILNHLRLSVIEALQQKGASGEQKDGMDISVLVINTETYNAQWAGANNPLYIVKSQKSKVKSVLDKLSDFGLEELKGDKMPIAIYPQMKDFTNHEFTLQKGDVIYLFTDGYADQFGGPKGRKFMYRQLKELLVLNYEKPMSMQMEILQNAFEEWKGNYEQIDDVTILGIRI